MTSTIKIPIRALNEELIKDLQEKYPAGELRILVHKNKKKAPLSKAFFWEIIALLDWDKVEDDEAIIAPAVSRLAAAPVRHILEFADLLSEFLYRLDTPKYAQNIGEEALKEGQYFSVDNFLYARCCVVANGKAAYENVLNTPEQMPKDLTFEALLTIPSEAYERKTSRPYSYVPAYPIETYSNRVAWGKNKDA